MNVLQQSFAGILTLSFFLLTNCIIIPSETSTDVGITINLLPFRIKLSPVSCGIDNVTSEIVENVTEAFFWDELDVAFSAADKGGFERLDILISDIDNPATKRVRRGLRAIGETKSRRGAASPTGVSFHFGGWAYFRFSPGPNLTQILSVFENGYESRGRQLVEEITIKAGENNQSSCFDSLVFDTDGFRFEPADENSSENDRTSESKGKDEIKDGDDNEDENKDGKEDDLSKSNEGPTDTLIPEPTKPPSKPQMQPSSSSPKFTKIFLVLVITTCCLVVVLLIGCLPYLKRKGCSIFGMKRSDMTAETEESGVDRINTEANPDFEMGAASASHDSLKKQNVTDDSSTLHINFSEEEKKSGKLKERLSIPGSKLMVESLSLESSKEKLEQLKNDLKLTLKPKSSRSHTFEPIVMSTSTDVENETSESKRWPYKENTTSPLAEQDEMETDRYPWTELINDSTFVSKKDKKSLKKFRTINELASERSKMLGTIVSDITSKKKPTRRRHRSVSPPRKEEWYAIMPSLPFEWDPSKENRAKSRPQLVQVVLPPLRRVWSTSSTNILISEEQDDYCTLSSDTKVKSPASDKVVSEGDKDENADKNKKNLSSLNVNLEARYESEFYSKKTPTVNGETTSLPHFRSPSASDNIMPDSEKDEKADANKKNLLNENTNSERKYKLELSIIAKITGDEETSSLPDNLFHRDNNPTNTHTQKAQFRRHSFSHLERERCEQIERKRSFGEELQNFTDSKIQPKSNGESKSQDSHSCDNRVSDLWKEVNVQQIKELTVDSMEDVKESISSNLTFVNSNIQPKLNEEFELHDSQSRDNGVSFLWKESNVGGEKESTFDSMGVREEDSSLNLTAADSKVRPKSNMELELEMHDSHSGNDTASDMWKESNVEKIKELRLDSMRDVDESSSLDYLMDYL